MTEATMRLFAILADELRGEGRFLGNCRSAEFIFVPVLASGLILLFNQATFRTSYALQDLVSTTGPAFKTCYALAWVLAGTMGLIGTAMGAARAYAADRRTTSVVERWLRIGSSALSCLLLSWLTFKFYITAPTILPTLPVYGYAVVLTVWNAMLAWNHR